MRLYILCVAALAVIAGCHEDEDIRQYQVAKEDRPADLRHKEAFVDMTGPDQGDNGPIRLLAGIFPQGERTWFFKLMAPKADIDPHAAEFEKFLHTVYFTGKADPPIAWTTPDGWKQEPGAGIRYATLRFGKGDSLDVSVSVTGGSLLANINRWRVQQLGLTAVTEAQLADLVHELKPVEASH